ncbi:hypothetical protein Kpol_1066p23 [Vanderwaltozyma polyspora DSM 70294]|uniref:Uncharacterized protein n=1 Tax=Vanderwaltozyma polyspora (strain ATCC 22028 / DSM 70294 / BCRC 21397 / CBS 2163 / NBRC 10782 / NRRL Y-8283 / UCD 57-17) TaxID=436907 RepID=A7TMP4_VANPO|nr:uncharacterized protein Kpol_1066p23 [Vanderwaltozyma polyspora DSM 70294]EDO16458.1 hypothetical protein Kpol_1066p23 [Vanderwaltozyma polyspora DSM 70294]
MSSSTDNHFCSKKHTSDDIDFDIEQEVLLQMKRQNSTGGKYYPDLNDINGGFSMIGVEEALDLLKISISTPLPDHQILFPWLHSYSDGLIDKPRIDGLLTVVRSKVSPDGNIENSGIFRSSTDPKDFFVNINDVSNLMGSENISNTIKDILLDLLTVDDNNFIEGTQISMDCLLSTCLQLNVIPFLKSDATIQSFISSNKRNRVGDFSSSSVIWKQTHSFRRFDLQCAKMVEASSKILIYCLHASNEHRFCSNCTTIMILLKISLNHLKKIYNNDSIHLPSFYILKYSNIENIPTELLAIPLLHNNSPLKENSGQLVSYLDVSAFNCWETNLLYHEKLEMSKLSSVTNIDDTKAVWAGNITDYDIYVFTNGYTNIKFDITKFDEKDLKTTVTLPSLTFDEVNYNLNDSKLFGFPSISKKWTLFIKCGENNIIPTSDDLWLYLEAILRGKKSTVNIEFPSSGSIGLGNLNMNSINSILNLCYVIHQLAKKDISTFIYCTDGYTENSFIIVAYLIFVWDLPIEKVLLKLHLDYERPFFLFHSDLQVLGHLQSILREFSPQREQNQKTYEASFTEKIPSQLEISSEMFSKIFFIKVPASSDLTKFKGPLPSKILPHLYLGSLEHTHSQELLRNLGINYIVSVGENLSWIDDQESTQHRARGCSYPVRIDLKDIYDVPLRPTLFRSSTSTSSLDQQLPIYNDTNKEIESTWSEVIEKDGFKILRVNNITDNGSDTLLHQFSHILEFIDDCYKNNGKVLVHCMVGVSRSATVCIAECMKRLKCDVIKAYLFVRVRRLNIIIQPNLMFMYELLRWQELQEGRKDHEWHILCRSIYELNKKYL